MIAISMRLNFTEILNLCHETSDCALRGIGDALCFKNLLGWMEERLPKKEYFFFGGGGGGVVSGVQI